jgi:predicted nucleotidyltransferase
MKYGLLERDLSYIKKGIEKFSEIEEVTLFGSRAMGNFKKASDVDLAIKGTKVTRTTVIRLSGVLNEEYPIPFFFDIIDYEKTSNIKLKEHIDKYGISLYKRT